MTANTINDGRQFAFAVVITLMRKWEREGL